MLSEGNKKTLPAESDSDYSLPGRYEESNSDYFDSVIVSNARKNRWIWISIISFAIVTSGFFAYYFLNQESIDSKIIENAIATEPEKYEEGRNIGKYGSAHAHAAIIITVDGSQVNFGLPQFQLGSKYIHFEDNNPYLVHRHATEVPLEMLFESLGIKITHECIMFNNYDSANIQAQYCISEGQSLAIYLNGKVYSSDISQYVIKHGDRILISFSDSKSIPKTLTYLESLEIFDIPRKTPQISENEINV